MNGKKAKKLQDFKYGECPCDVEYETDKFNIISLLKLKCVISGLSAPPNRIAKVIIVFKQVF